MNEQFPEVAKSYIHRFRVGYADTDQMGFLHHSRHPVYMEFARTEMLRALGETYKGWEADGFLLPVVRLEIDFKSPARYDDTIDIHTSLEVATRLRMEFRYDFVHAERGDILAIGITRHVIMGPDGRPRRLAPEKLAVVARTLQPRAD